MTNEEFIAYHKNNNFRNWRELTKEQAKRYWFYLDISSEHLLFFISKHRVYINSSIWLVNEKYVINNPTYFTKWWANNNLFDKSMEDIMLLWKFNEEREA